MSTICNYISNKWETTPTILKVTLPPLALIATAGFATAIAGAALSNHLLLMVGNISAIGAATIGGSIYNMVFWRARCCKSQEANDQEKKLLAVQVEGKRVPYGAELEQAQL